MQNREALECCKQSLMGFSGGCSADQNSKITKSYGVTEASTQVSMEGLGGQAIIKAESGSCMQPIHEAVRVKIKTNGHPSTFRNVKKKHSRQ
jgi:hypothetical protein